MHRLSWAQLLQHLLNDAWFYEELARRDVIRPRLQDGSVGLGFEHDRLSPAARQWIAVWGYPNYRQLMELWLRTQIVVAGPKVIQPSLEQCVAMEQVAPRIPVAEYVQPY